MRSFVFYADLAMKQTEKNDQKSSPDMKNDKDSEEFELDRDELRDYKRDLYARRYR